MSVGALLDESIFEVLYDACKEFKKTIHLPSGAIAGLDGIKSVKDELESVTLTTTKHPRSLKGAKFFENHDVDLDIISNRLKSFQVLQDRRRYNFLQTSMLQLFLVWPVWEAISPK